MYLERGRAGRGCRGQERKTATLYVGVREKRELLPMGLTKERTHRKKWVALLALSQWQPPQPQFCSTCPAAILPPVPPSEESLLSSVPPVIKDQVVESSGLSSQGQGTGHIPNGMGWETSKFRPWGLFLSQACETSPQHTASACTDKASGLAKQR